MLPVAAASSGIIGGIGSALGGLGGALSGLLGGLGGLSGITGLAGSAMQAGSQGATNAMNERLMRESWARDDSAIQRKVADLKAAGLHPSLASGGGMSSTPVQLQNPIKDNPVLSMLEASQRHANVAMSNVQREIAGAQLARESASARIEKKKADIFEATGVLPGQEPSFMGIKLPAGWMQGAKDVLGKVPNPYSVPVGKHKKK